MKKYELLSIIKPNLDMDEVEKVLKNLDETIQKLDGSVVNIDKLGRKKLAYDIQNYRDGFMTVMIIELPGDQVEKLKRNIKLNENFLRISFISESKIKATAK